MYLSTITLKNFRKYAYNGIDKHGITVFFHKGLNALIGENDSGKSAVIDAIKLVLQTQSGEFTRVTDEDFYIAASGEIATEFSIDCIFEGFESNEAKNFIEWLTFEKDKTSGAVFYKLFLHYRAWRENGRIYTELKAGDAEDGILLDSKARELLKCVYLRPLRDAQKEMHSGRSSRISQILFSHPLFSNKEDNALVNLIMQANEGIEKYFLEEEGQEILGKIRNTLAEFLDKHTSKNATIKTSEMRLKSILESLSLVAPEIQPGLGVHNLLFIAAELLLLNSDTNGSLKLAVIEELEAHLHPQAQLRLISYLQKEYNNSGVQVIISTHSAILASKINVKNLILLKNDSSFNLNAEYTGLEKGDYLFLQRFLDSTKAKVLHYIGIKDEAGKEYRSMSVKQYISHNFPQLYQSSILSLSQIDDFSYFAVEEKIKEIFTALLGEAWLENLPDAFIPPSLELRTTTEDSHIFCDNESSISIMFDTVYGVKGETHDATLYLETETKKSSDIRRILPLLEHKSTQCKNELQEKSRRCVYVGFSRPKYLLCLAISEKTYIGHETAFSSWKIVDLRSEDAI